MNPFKKNNQILPLASINSVYIDDILASDLFRPSILIKVLEENKDLLGINKDITGEELLFAFNDSLMSNDSKIHEKANEIAHDFGDRLGSVLLTLKKPSEQSKNMRTNWTETHWNYWQDVKSLTLVGGLTSPILTNIFMKRINRILDTNGIDDLEVSFIEGSSNLGTLGLSNLVQNGEYLLFDFGQTNIKRAHHIKHNNKSILYRDLSQKKSDYLFYKYKDSAELIKLSHDLHEYILDTILTTMKEVQFDGNNILLSIANYVQNGAIYKSRGGYGKLALLTEYYQGLLNRDLAYKTGRDITAELYHDTTAMSLALDQSQKGAVISLGTAFGVAFID